MGVTDMQKFNNLKAGVLAVFANIPIAVKVLTIAAMTLTSLYLTGLLNINHQVAHYLGYAMSVLTLYVALKSIK